MKSKLLIIFAVLTLNCFSMAWCSNKKPSKCPTEKEIQKSILEKELNQLTLILTKYGNNPEGVPPIHYAVIKNDVKAIDLLLKYGADPFTRDSNRKSCLYHAITTGNVSLVKRFIAFGDNPFGLYSLTGTSNASASALTKSVLYGQPEVARYLLEEGHHNNKILNNAFFCMLSHSGTQFPKDKRKEFVLLFIKHGLDLNSIEVNNATHLQQFLVAHRNDAEMADFLRSLGAE